MARGREHLELAVSLRALARCTCSRAREEHCLISPNASIGWLRAAAPRRAFPTKYARLICGECGSGQVDVVVNVTEHR